MSYPQNMKTCAICSTEANVRNLDGFVDAYAVDCQKCGKFSVPGLLTRTVLMGGLAARETQELLPYLSAHTRQATERGEPVVLESENWREFAEAHKNTPFSMRVRKLLEVLAARSAPGVPVPFDRRLDFGLADIASWDELLFVWEHLKQLGYLSQPAAGTWFVAPKAWEYLESSVGISRRCFIAMSFDPSMDHAFRIGIEPALRIDCKMDPLRIDKKHHNDKICDKIIAEIRTCQFLVADVTLQRAGVYFEAGFAMGLGRPVVWSCREDDLKNVHFDTRQYNHIVWKEPADLRSQLADRIRATIPGAT